MVYSLPDLPHPLSFICIIAILILYVRCCCLVIGFICQDEEIVFQDSHVHAYHNSSYYRLSVEELQEITCVYHKVGPNFSICAICLENLSRGEVCRVLPACRHEFHAHCIDSWLSKKLTCPTCLAPFRPQLSVCG